MSIILQLTLAINTLAMPVDSPISPALDINSIAIAAKLLQLNDYVEDDSWQWQAQVMIIVPGEKTMYQNVVHIEEAVRYYRSRFTKLKQIPQVDYIRRIIPPKKLNREYLLECELFRDSLTSKLKLIPNNAHGNIYKNAIEETDKLYKLHNLVNQMHDSSCGEGKIREAFYQYINEWGYHNATIGHFPPPVPMQYIPYKK